MTATISGTVSGPGGTPICGAVVRAVHEPTGSTFGKITDEQGSYLFDRIKIGGPYAILAIHDEYKIAERKGIHVKTEEVHVEDFKMAAR